jgi:hypothetical protein
MILRGMLVGERFAPPAMVLIQALPAGAIVQLTPDRTNLYDSKAIRVSAKPAAFDPEVLGGLEEQLGGFGVTLDDVASATALPLGHVGATGGKPLAIAADQGHRLDGTEDFHQHVRAWPCDATVEFVDGRTLLVVDLDAEHAHGS